MLFVEKYFVSYVDILLLKCVFRNAKKFNANGFDSELCISYTFNDMSAF